MFVDGLCFLQFVSEGDLEGTSLKVIQKKKLLSLVNPAPDPAAPSAMLRSSSGTIDKLSGSGSVDKISNSPSLSKRPFRAPPPPPPAPVVAAVAETSQPVSSGSRKGTPKVSFFSSVSFVFFFFLCRLLG